jgi:alpha-tubulin suppressor-like RCC1 family protein
VPSSLAKNSKNEYVARNTALEAQLTSSQNDKSESMFTKVYVMGETKHGQLGFMLDENTESVIRMPKLCNYNVLVKQIACGEAHTHILSREGFVYSMGVNHYGVLGLSVSEMQLNSVTEP